MIVENLRELAAALHAVGYWVAYALLSGLLLTALRRIRRLHEWDHHGYFGMVLCLLPWTWVRVVGMVFLLDDVVQHSVQALDLENGRTPRADWSPIHKGYVAVYRWIAAKLAKVKG